MLFPSKKDKVLRGITKVYTLMNDALVQRIAMLSNGDQSPSNNEIKTYREIYDQAKNDLEQLERDLSSLNPPASATPKLKSIQSKFHSLFTIGDSFSTTRRLLLSELLALEQDIKSI